MADTFAQLEAGYEFPPGEFTLDASRISNYLKAIGDASYPYLDARLVPPMAVAALALATLSNTISLPPGSIHVSQEVAFSGVVRMDDRLTSYARISRAQKRGKLHLIAVDINVRNQAQQTVPTGKTSFVLPQAGGE